MVVAIVTIAVAVPLVGLGGLGYASSAALTSAGADQYSTSTTTTTTTTPTTKTSGPVASRTQPMSTTPSRMWRPPARTNSAVTDSPSDTPAPVLDDHPPPATRANTKNLHWGTAQLNAQNIAVQPLVEKCIADAAEKGVKPSGTATLTYIVIAKGDKVTVEDTGFDDSKTTLQAPELVDCMRETARSMKFEGLPREAEGLVVTRTVTLDAGKLVDYKHVSFSYLR
jgi:hypothetical protein